MHIAEGMIQVDGSLNELLNSLSKFFGFPLTLLSDIPQPITETKTSNKLFLEDRNSRRQFILKERPVYLSKERSLFSAEVVWRVKESESKIVPIQAGVNGSLHFELSERLYVLMPVIAGEHPWDMKDDAERIGWNLAEMHDAMKAQTLPKDKAISISDDLENFACVVEDNASGVEDLLRAFDELISSVSGSAGNVQIIHGDVAPSNVLLKQNRQCVFLDFDNVSIGSVYYDIASLCQTFGHLQYQKNCSHLAEVQTLSVSSEVILSLITGYFGKCQSLTDITFDLETFMGFYHLVWIEHMLLGALRGDFSAVAAQKWGAGFDVVQTQLVDCLKEFQ